MLNVPTLLLSCDVDKKHRLWMTTSASRFNGPHQNCSQQQRWNVTKKSFSSTVLCTNSQVLDLSICSLYNLILQDISEANIVCFTPLVIKSFS